MSKKRIIQKLISFESKKRDFSELEKELVDGWGIANIMPHKGGFLCVLEKNIDNIASNLENNISVREMLQLTKLPRKNKILQDA
jgi:hypothetical protein